MIKQIKDTLKNIFSSDGDDIVEEEVNEGIAFKEEAKKHYDLEDEEPYVGVPAPAYLKEDEWFGAPPEYTEKQKEYMEMETEMKRQEFEQTFSAESEDIHQRMYEIATESQKTTVHLNPPGGSENFHGGNNGYGWMSGTGMNQFQNG
ncbi:MAG: hypothetical protein VW454_05880 [Pelagibacteraceae bacterium]